MDSVVPAVERDAEVAGHKLLGKNFGASDGHATILMGSTCARFGAGYCTVAHVELCDNFVSLAATNAAVISCGSEGLNHVYPVSVDPCAAIRVGAFLLVVYHHPLALVKVAKQI